MRTQLTTLPNAGLRNLARGVNRPQQAIFCPHDGQLLLSLCGCGSGLTLMRHARRVRRVCEQAIESRSFWSQRWNGWRGHASSVDSLLNSSELNNALVPGNELISGTVVNGPQTIWDGRPAIAYSSNVTVTTRCSGYLKRDAAARNHTSPHPTPPFISGLGCEIRAYFPMEVGRWASYGKERGTNGGDRQIFPSWTKDDLSEGEPIRSNISRYCINDFEVLRDDIS